MPAAERSISSSVHCSNPKCKDEDKVGAMEKVAKNHFMSFRNGGNELVRDESTANLAANAEVFSMDSFKGSRSLRGGAYSTVELDEMNSFGR